MQTGSITVIFGPMFSGKTSELMRLVKRFTIAERKCLVLKYAHDQRYSDEEVISTHDRQHYSAVKIIQLLEIEKKCYDYDVVAIDEGQFFPDIHTFCEKLANNGIVVLVAALDGTFERKPFGNILQLIPLAERLMKLTAVCWFCKQENAAFTKRTTDSTEIELIGGDETYKPSCRACFDGKHLKEVTTNTALTAKKAPRILKEAENINI